MSTVYDEISTRVAFGNALLRYAETDGNVFAVSADTEKSMGFAPLAKARPDRVINVGIAEQNMMLVGTGLAASGAKVYVATYAPFASMRMLEQIRSFCAYPKLDVKIISGLAGLSGDVEGVTHQGLEDVSILRSIPNMVVVVPADAASAEVITQKISEYEGPVYFRVGRNAVPKVFDESYTFEIGKANVVKEEGNDAAIIFNGATTSRVIEAEKSLREKGYNVQLIEMPCVKPIDKEAIIKAAKETGAIITVEEGNIIGGLGGAVAEVLGENYPTLMKRIGIDDIFTESGPHKELLDKYNFSPEHIEEVIIEVIHNKGSY
ncbi:transketolase family protein [Bacillus sp. OTU530]|uniref:transketolase family protein n=1 Tax=Bacillus sp. OTU530 TaxID=3043862 RepID=UPI00313E0C7A